MTKGLSPSILRVGGTAANFLTYDPNPVEEGAKDYKTNSLSQDEKLINETGRIQYYQSCIESLTVICFLDKL